MKTNNTINFTGSLSVVAMKYIYIIFFALVVVTTICLEWEFLSNRMLRTLTSWVFLMSMLALLAKKMATFIPFTAFLLLAICDIFLLNWELGFAKPGYYMTHSLASITFLFTVDWKGVKLLLTKLDWLYILIIISILSWVMVTLGQYFSEEMNDPILQAIFYINGFLSVILSISAFIFSANSTNNHSSYFLLAIIGLTISDLFLFMIYVMDFHELRYFDNFLNIFGCTLLAKYMIEKQSLRKKEATNGDDVAHSVIEEDAKIYS